MPNGLPRVVENVAENIAEKVAPRAASTWRTPATIRLSTQANDDLLERNLKGETAAAWGDAPAPRHGTGRESTRAGGRAAAGPRSGPPWPCHGQHGGLLGHARGARDEGTLKLMVEPAHRARVPPKSCKNVPLQIRFYCLITSKF